MSAPGAVTAARVYAEAGAANAFARRLLIAHGVPADDSAMIEIVEIAMATCRKVAARVRR